MIVLWIVNVFNDAFTDSHEFEWPSNTFQSALHDCPCSCFYDATCIAMLVVFLTTIAVLNKMLDRCFTCAWHVFQGCSVSSSCSMSGCPTVVLHVHVFWIFNVFECFIIWMWSMLYESQCCQLRCLKGLPCVFTYYCNMFEIRISCVSVASYLALSSPVGAELRTTSCGSLVENKELFPHIWQLEDEEKQQRSLADHIVITCWVFSRCRVAGRCQCVVWITPVLSPC